MHGEKKGGYDLIPDTLIDLPMYSDARKREKKKVMICMAFSFNAEGKKKLSWTQLDICMVTAPWPCGDLRKC